MNYQYYVLFCIPRRQQPVPALRLWHILTQAGHVSDALLATCGRWLPGSTGLYKSNNQKPAKFCIF